MKIVIDIEEGRYNWIMSHASNHPGDYINADSLVFRKAVESGIPVPKGHGDLIDRSVVVNELNEQQVEFDEFYKGLGRAKTITNNVPTVIPADKEESIT